MEVITLRSAISRFPVGTSSLQKCFFPIKIGIIINGMAFHCSNKDANLYKRNAGSIMKYWHPQIKIQQT